MASAILTPPRRTAASAPARKVRLNLELPESLKRQLDDLVTGNKDHEAMVHQLEQLYDSDDGFDNEGRNHPSMSGPIDGNELPSGEELAAELEQFLRDQG